MAKEIIIEQYKNGYSYRIPGPSYRIAAQLLEFDGHYIMYSYRESFGASNAYLRKIFDLSEKEVAEKFCLEAIIEDVKNDPTKPKGKIVIKKKKGKLEILP